MKTLLLAIPALILLNGVAIAQPLLKASAGKEKSKELQAYAKSVEHEIGRHWYYLVTKHSATTPLGTVFFSFWIDPKGKVHDLKVTKGVGDFAALADLSKQAILRATLPKFPPEVAKISGSKLECIDYKFELY